MLPFQTGLKIMTISLQVTVFVLQTPPGGSAKKDFSALQGPMNLLLAQEGIIVKAKERMMSQLSVTQAGFAQVMLRFHGHLME